MGAVLPALDAHALARIQPGQRPAVTTLQPIAQHEEDAVELLPAQVVGQAIGVAARRAGPPTKVSRNMRSLSSSPFRSRADSFSTSLEVCGNSAALRSSSSR
jgi:hypothetical protein